MIHTVTLGPSLDLTYHVRDFRTDDNNRATELHRAPGGKGINVSRVATRLAHPTVALGFLGGTTGMEVTTLLEQEGVQTWFTTIDGTTRTNPIIQNAAGEHLRVISPAPRVTPEDATRLWNALFALRHPDFLVLGGSLPRDTPRDFFVRAARKAREDGVRVVADADGEELRALVEAGVSIIKPNQYELSRLVGRDLTSLSDIRSACEEVLSRGVTMVVVSLGAEGALLVQANRSWRAAPPSVRVQSPVGAGDSLVAGLTVKLAEGWTPPDALRFGVACGTATATRPGTALCEPTDIEALLPRVDLHEL